MSRIIQVKFLNAVVRIEIFRRNTKVIKNAYKYNLLFFLKRNSLDRD